MQFLYHKDSGEKNIILDNQAFHHVFNVRRQKDSILILANMLDSKLYSYKILQVGKKQATLELIDSKSIKQNSPKTHIIQAIIDMNEFSKTLPYLNELFVEKITFFYSDFSQRNEKINIEKLHKILLNSSMQCGRLSIMKIEIMKNLNEVLNIYRDSIALDFNDNRINIKNHNSFIIGAEGGFSKNERELLKDRLFGIDNPLIMRAKTASIFVAANKI
ncbi:RsmE family RNA methyltransferase [Helicobacter sp. MIT 99-5507]|uniref:16S rRNA (uracil(1498)-N(3))-methyltransferase n=1 Tax=Helicobacter sp. MIT 99-5507 TaxID=152489 RepID=UPI0015F1B1ED|nr:RsmE family RNA methyltransferase [Helicobacter sp. MIT 99-5507]